MRSPDGSLQGFKDGVSVLILQARKPVVPMAITGSIKTMHKDEFSIHPGRVRVRIGRPMVFDGFKEVNLDSAKIISSKLKDAIAGLMHEGLQPGV
jgi:1-acyl-sn-glycerol-3-phosphate acyltransferase